MTRKGYDFIKPKMKNKYFLIRQKEFERSDTFNTEIGITTSITKFTNITANCVTIADLQALNEFKVLIRPGALYLRYNGKC